jgi:hypothetical protein
VEPGVPRSGRFIALLRDVLIGLGHPPLFPCTHIGPCPFPGPLKGAGPREFSPDSTGRQSSESGTKPKATLSRRPPPVRRNPPAGQDSGRGASKWCHFAFDTRDAPAALLRLSAAAGLSKDRATLSFLLAGPPDPDPCDSVIPGDPHPLPVVSGARGPVDAPFSPGALPSPSVSSSPGDWTPCPPLRIISDPFPLGAGGDSREWGRYGCFKGGMALVRGREPQIGSLSPGVLVRAMSAGRRDPKSGALLCRVAD